MAKNISSKIVKRVVTVDENTTVLEAAVLMTKEFIGSVIVTSSTGIHGIFTERDLMMRVVGEQEDPGEVKIKDVLKEIVKVSPDDSAGFCLKLMETNRCRHLLVFHDDEFIGIISLRDIVTLLIDEKEELISHLENYLTS